MIRVDYYFTLMVDLLYLLTFNKNKLILKVNIVNLSIAQRRIFFFIDLVMYSFGFLPIKEV